jgi:uncharacterized YccA/Bax inhibitor family protein
VEIIEGECVMTSGSVALGPQGDARNSTPSSSPGNNPALNPQAFARGIAEGGASDRTMTVGGTYAITGLLLVLLVLGAAFGWSQTQIVSVNGRDVALTPSWTWLAFLLTFVLGIGAAFAVRAAPILSILYALVEGSLLGVASRFYDLQFDGIVSQAVLATFAIFLAVYILYATRIIKVTSRFVLGVVAAMGALAILWSTAWLLSLFGAELHFLYSPTPLGIGIAIAIVILGALNLPIDFAFIEGAAEAGAPRYMQWYGAYGLMLSLIWMYISILRLLALLRAASG